MAQQGVHMSAPLAGISRSLAEALDIQAILFMYRKVFICAESAATPYDAGKLHHDERNEQYKSHNSQ